MDQLGKELKLRKWDPRSPNPNNGIALNIQEDYIWLSLNGNSGIFSISPLFFRHKGVKKQIQNIKNLVKFGATSEDQLIAQVFPEIVTEEFEKTVLGKKE